MSIKDLPKYKDIRNTIRRNGRYPVVGTGVKDTHVIHQSMTPRSAKGSNPNSFANTHIDIRGWQGIAYVFVIMPDGTIYQCDDLDRRTNHAGDTNTRSIGTCVVGDFRKDGANEQPTPEQIESLYLLNKELYKELPNMKQTIGHQECPGYAWKNCPGDTWDYKKAIEARPAQESKPVPTKSEKDVFDVPLKVGDKGDAVRLLHTQLAALGYTQWKNVEIDTFGTWTEDAVKRFQQDQKMTKPTPGVVDYETASAFAKVLAVFYKDRLQPKT